MQSNSASPGTESPRLASTQDVRPRRRRSESNLLVRYFLLKPGSSQTTPELGQEMSSEGEALIEAFRTGQPFYSVVVWKAVPQVNGGSPVIVKQTVSQNTS